MSLIFVNKTSFANSYLFVNNSKPSNEINESLPQSRNHGYPAITVCNPKDGLFTIKLSVANIKAFNISSFLSFILLF